MEFKNKSKCFADIWQGLEVHCYKEISSTSDWAKSYLRDHSQDEILIISKTQTKGRGRSGRSFYSEIDHGLYFTLGIRPKITELNDLPLYTIAAATALMLAVEKELRLDLKVKWVNDLFYKGKKVAGILSEATTNPETKKISSLVIGVGLNVAGSFEDADVSTQDVAGTLYDKLPPHFNLKDLLRKFLKEFRTFHQNMGAKEFLPVYEKKLLGIGQEVRYERKKEYYYGIIEGVNESGHLLVRSELDEVLVLLSEEIHFSSQQFRKMMGE